LFTYNFSSQSPILFLTINYSRHPPEPEMCSPPGNTILRPKTFRRKPVLLKLRKNGKIESVVDMIFPSLGTGPNPEYVLPEPYIQENTEKIDKKGPTSIEEIER
jgi:hypothetical protein